MTQLRMYLAIIFTTLLYSIEAQIVDIHILNIKDFNGQICVAIFSDASNFKTEKPIRDLKFEKSLIQNGILNLKILMKEGIYGISVLDDVNENGKMEYKLFGIPREGFGFSNYFHKGLKKPIFEDFSFILNQNEVKQITVLMKYF